MCPGKLGDFIIHEEENGLEGWITGSVCHNQLPFMELLLCTRYLPSFAHLILTTLMRDKS